MFPIQAVAVAAATVLSSSHAVAGIVASYDIGTGAATSTLQVDFADGDGYLVTLRWDPATSVTGFDALQRMRDAIAGSVLQYDQYPFGVFVTGIGLGTDYDYGTGDLWPIENYWHYWTKVGGQWEMAMFGAGDRLLSDGSADAWVFGSSAVPQAVPAPGALVLLLAAPRSRRRRMVREERDQCLTSRAGGRGRGRSGRTPASPAR